MPLFAYDDVSIRYEDQGSGFPILLLAPGALSSSIEQLQFAPWDLVEDLSQDYRVVTMDQRHTGQSAAPLTDEDGWDDYCKDQLALMDFLEADQFHVVGMCVGVSFGLNLIAHAPTRIRSHVGFNPIGPDDNRDMWSDLYDTWAADHRLQHPDVEDATWAAFKESMFGGDFVFSVDEASARQCPTPTLILMGHDKFHTEKTSLDLIDALPDVSVVEFWKEEPHRAEARHRVREFLSANTP